ncbi:3668_t:CDS:1, partial [Gigaspora rosea]
MQKAVEMTPAPDTQPANFNFNKINKGKQKAVEMTPAPDTQPTDFGMNPPPSEMNLGPDTQPLMKLIKTSKR